MKCQHGQIISKFCIAENCDSKTAGGCLYCLNKDHFHHGHVETLNLDQVNGLIKTLSTKNNTKSMQLNLKQLLTNYFQGLKTQLSRSLDTVYQSMIDRVSNAYLFNSGALQTYNKIQAKDHKAISPQELRQLYLLSEKNPDKNLQKEEQRYYYQQVHQLKSTIESIKKVLDSYQSQVSSYDKHFSADSFVYKQIIELTEKITVSHPRQSVKQQRAKLQFKPYNPVNFTRRQSKPQSNHPNLQNHQTQPHTKTEYQAKYEIKISQRQKPNPEPFKIKVTPQLKHNPQNDLFNRSFIQPDQPKLLSLAEYRNQRSQRTKSTEQIKSKTNINLDLLNVKGRRQRKLSVNMHQLSPKNKNQSSDGNSTNNRSILSIQVVSPISKLEELYKKDVSNLKLKNHSYKIQDDVNKEFCIQIIDPKISQDLTQASELPLLNGRFQWKQCNSEVSTGQAKKDHQKLNKGKNIPYFIKNFDYSDANKKTTNIKNENTGKDILNLAQPSHFRNNILSNFHDQNLQLRKTQSTGINREIFPKIRKLSNQYPIKELQQIYLHQDEMKSAAILFQSLKLSPQLAIQYLRKSFQHCPYNLSTAEYLSFMLLEENHPKQCLELCNYILMQIKSTDNFSFSVHILNNKAAALNLLGRFSECIHFVEKVIEHVEKDTLYKNLGDAYCALGITEKSIANYKKCIALNQQQDQAFYNLAACFYTLHRYPQALQMVSQAIRLNSEKAEYIELYRNTKTKVL